MKLLRLLRLSAYLVRLHAQVRTPRGPRRQWECFWRTVERTGRDGQVVWDAAAERAAALDLWRFRRHLDDSLPLLDLGCGNGRQTRFLARRFDYVLGADLSPAAVELARRESGGEVDFRVLDAARPDEAEALHAELGDVNIYLRSVFHGVPRADRADFVRSLEILLGTRGILYMVEPTQGTLRVFLAVGGDTASGLPQVVEDSIRHGMRPPGFRPKDRDTHLSETRWEVLDEGEDVAIHTILEVDGHEVRLPARYLVLRPRAMADRATAPSRVHA